MNADAGSYKQKKRRPKPTPFRMKNPGTALAVREQVQDIVSPY